MSITIGAGCVRAVIFIMVILVGIVAVAAAAFLGYSEGFSHGRRQGREEAFQVSGVSASPARLVNIAGVEHALEQATPTCSRSAPA